MCLFTRAFLRASGHERNQHGFVSLETFYQGGCPRRGVGQRSTDWSGSISRAPLSAGPAAAAACTGGSAYWGENHLRLERVAVEPCLAARTAGSGSQVSLKWLLSCCAPVLGSAQWPSRKLEPAADFKYPYDVMRSPSLAARANVTAWQALFKGGSRAHMPAQPRVHRLFTSESQHPTQ